MSPFSTSTSSVRIKSLNIYCIRLKTKHVSVQFNLVLNRTWSHPFVYHLPLNQLKSVLYLFHRISFHVTAMTETLKNVMPCAFLNWLCSLHCVLFKWSIRSIISTGKTKKLHIMTHGHVNLRLSVVKNSRKRYIILVMLCSIYLIFIILIACLSLNDSKPVRTYLD